MARRRDAATVLLVVPNQGSVTHEEVGTRTTDEAIPPRGEVAGSDAGLSGLGVEEEQRVVRQPDPHDLPALLRRDQRLGAPGGEVVAHHPRRTLGDPRQSRVVGNQPLLPPGPCVSIDVRPLVRS